MWPIVKRLWISNWWIGSIFMCAALCQPAQGNPIASTEGYLLKAMIPRREYTVIGVRPVQCLPRVTTYHFGQGCSISAATESRHLMHWTPSPGSSSDANGSLPSPNASTDQPVAPAPVGELHIGAALVPPEPTQRNGARDPEREFR